MIRRLTAPFVIAAAVLYAGQALAQGAFPAPLPGRTGTVNDPAFPPVNGAAPAQSFGHAAAPASLPGSAPMASSPFTAPPTQSGAIEVCMKEFLPMRAEAERRGKLLKAASEKHSGAEEACKLIKGFLEAEVKMMKFVETNAARCGIPPQIGEQLKSGHKHTEEMKVKICSAAEQQVRGPAGPSLSDVLGSAATLPEASEKKKSGGVFDTLSGNPLAR